MAIQGEAFANANDAPIAWEPNDGPNALVGFQWEWKDQETAAMLLIFNRIPQNTSKGATASDGISSSLCPIQRCTRADCHLNVTSFVSALGQQGVPFITHYLRDGHVRPAADVACRSSIV